MQTCHGLVKGHTKGINIFSKDFISIPAHKGLHWTLIVVCSARTHLKGAALLSWELECQDAVLAEGCSAVSWDQFERFMLDSFGLLQPVTETRSAYDVMVQSDYDTVSEFVREFRLKERELIGTPYHPGGSAIVDFIKKLTPAVRKYVQDNAPQEWWTYVKHVYKKSLQYELNQRAAVTVRTDNNCEPDVGLDIASESERDDDDLLEHDIERGRKRVRTPPSVWDATKKSQTCYRCGRTWPQGQGLRC
ncbi:TPA: hypothetical protein ACH3X1_004814 [Trebouxia sp. C0004]